MSYMERKMIEGDVIKSPLILWRNEIVKINYKKVGKLTEYLKNNKLIICTLLGFLSFGCICWLGSEKTKDFGLNFFTEILGVFITVFIIDKLIQNREEKRNLPQKLAAYEDVRLYISRYISFWTNTFRECVPEEDPETLEDFFSEKGMPKILNYLYMDSEPNVTPPTKWWDWLVHNAREFKETGAKILDRHSNNLDPVAYGYIHQLTESSFNSMLLLTTTIRQSDIVSNFPRIKVLGNYSIKPLKEDFDAILGLSKWCNEKYIQLGIYSKSIKRVSEYSKIPKNNSLPKCMIPNSILLQQMNELKKFRGKS